MSIATFCLECIYSLVEYLTKFATVRMAITGEAFFDAARRATDLLTRNFLKVTPKCPVLIVTSIGGCKCCAVCNESVVCLCCCYYEHLWLS